MLPLFYFFCLCRHKCCIALKRECAERGDDISKIWPLLGIGAPAAAYDIPKANLARITDVWSNVLRDDLERIESHETLVIHKWHTLGIHLVQHDTEAVHVHLF